MSKEVLSVTDDTELAAYLARRLFELPKFGNDKVQRIQFRGGDYRVRETDMGGLCETALIDVLAGFMRELREGKK